MYITYDEYLSMGGVIEDTTIFNRAVRRASAELDYRTMGRLRSVTDIDDDIKQCLTEMIDVCAAGYIQYGAPDGVRAVSSESNDGVSISYATASINDWFATVYPGRVAEIMSVYLADKCDEYGVPLLYKGCGV